MDLKSIGFASAFLYLLSIALVVDGEPSCKKDGRKFPDSSSCSHYFSCRNGKLERAYCGLLKNFDQATGNCLIWWKAGCSKAECNVGDGKAVLSDCTSYYPCDPSTRKWSKVKAACEKGQGFDWEKSTCVDNYDCSKTPICEEGERKARSDAGSKDCRGYSECSGGKWKERSCFYGFGYSPFEKKCRFMQECPYCQKGDKMPVSSDCKAYMECKDGRWSRGSCGFLSRLDPSSLDCRFFFFVHCDQDGCKEGQTKGMIKEGGASSSSSSSFYPDRYLLCRRGEWIEERCSWPKGRFDLQTGRCETSWGSDEGEGPSGSGRSPSKRKTKREVSRVETRQEGESGEGDACKGDWKKAYQGDCSKYYQCVEGVVRVKSCSVMMRFDRESLQCEFGWYVKCDESKKPDSNNNEDKDKDKDKDKNKTAECRESERRGVRGSCTQYKACRNGKWRVETCLLNKEFDVETTTCLPKGKAQCSRPSWEPSFLFKVCNDGERKPISFRCDGYQICSDGEWALTQCDDGQRFDYVSLKCLPYSQAKCFVPDCQKGQRRSAGTNCRSYQECIEGLWRNDSCYWPKKFDSLTGACAWPWSKIQCGGGEKVTKRETSGGEVNLKEGDGETTTTLSPTTTTLSPNTTTLSPTTTTLGPDDKCPNGLIYPVKGSCKGYNVCDPSNGAVTLKSCSSCKNFDESTSKCVWVWKKICQDGSDPTAPTTIAPPSDKCQEGDKRKKPGEDGVNCRGYQQCDSDGNWVDKKCWWPWQYDRDLKKCTFWKGKC